MRILEAVQSQHQEVVTPLDTREEEEGLCHGPGLSDFLGLDPDHILTGVGAWKPENLPYTATASGTRALPGNNASVLHCEES